MDLSQEETSRVYLQTISVITSHLTSFTLSLLIKLIVFFLGHSATLTLLPLVFSSGDQAIESFFALHFLTKLLTN